jgi:hypothetical protein
MKSTGDDKRVYRQAGLAARVPGEGPGKRDPARAPPRGRRHQPLSPEPPGALSPVVLFGRVLGVGEASCRVASGHGACARVRSRTLAPRTRRDQRARGEGESGQRFKSREPRVVRAIAVAFLTAFFARSISTFRSREPRVFGAAAAAFFSAASALFSAIARSREKRVRVPAFVFVLFMALSSAETGPNRKRRPVTVCCTGARRSYVKWWS